MVIFVHKNGSWHRFYGSLETAKRQRKPHAREFDGRFGPMSTKATQRPSNYFSLSPEEQWSIDKNLGILDWDGDPSS